jgi:L-asparaginase II
MHCGVEVTRGGVVESVHAVSVAICRMSPAGDESIVDVGVAGSTAESGELPLVFARSAVKPLQAVPLIESGAAERFGLDDAEIAVATGSHQGDTIHVATVRSLLAKAGLRPESLACGIHRPLGLAAAEAIAREGGQPQALHNNCSGKHAGMLAVCRHLGFSVAGYTAADHPVQRMVSTTLCEFAGVPESDVVTGIDGCGIPALAMPLEAWARAYARFGSASGLSTQRSHAAERLRYAMASRPVFIAGAKQFDSVVAELLGPTVLVKTGAEGTLAGVVVDAERATGLAVKAHDGAGRAARAVMAKLLLVLGVARQPEAIAYLAREANEQLVNHAGTRVGAVRVVLPASA